MRAFPHSFLQRTFFLFLSAALFLNVHRAFCTYTDEIGVQKEELWQAAREVFQTMGIAKEDYPKMKIQTNWTYDRVVRSRGLLKKVAREAYERRYKIEMQLVPSGENTTVKITGRFQERPSGSAPAVMWKKVKPEMQDYDVEHDIFVKILKKLETLR